MSPDPPDRVTRPASWSRIRKIGHARGARVLAWSGATKRGITRPEPRPDRRRGGLPTAAHKLSTELSTGSAAAGTALRHGADAGWSRPAPAPADGLVAAAGHHPDVRQPGA